MTPPQLEPDINRALQNFQDLAIAEMLISWFAAEDNPGALLSELLAEWKKRCLASFDTAKKAAFKETGIVAGVETELYEQVLAEAERRIRSTVTLGVANKMGIVAKEEKPS